MPAAASQIKIDGPRQYQFRRGGSIIIRLSLLVLPMIFSWPAAWARKSDSPAGSWAHHSRSLLPDPQVVWGAFDNGFRYALLPHQALPGRVSMRLIVLAGSLDEGPEELGIAHFIEHMAYNGTRHFESGALRAFFQDLGMDMGSDINATTTFDHTVYMLEFRENAEDQLRQGLLLLRDFAEGISFELEEIEKEKGVILSEMRGIGGLRERAQMASLGTIYAGMMFPNRTPIGTRETIVSFKRDDFLRYYRRMYRSDLSILVVTGEFGTEELLSIIEIGF